MKSSDEKKEFDFEVMLARGRVNSFGCLVWAVDLSGVKTPSHVEGFVVVLAGFSCFLVPDGLGSVPLHGERNHLYRSSRVRDDRRVHQTRVSSTRISVAGAVVMSKHRDAGCWGRWCCWCWRQSE